MPPKKRGTATVKKISKYIVSESENESDNDKVGKHELASEKDENQNKKKDSPLESELPPVSRPEVEDHGDQKASQKHKNLAQTLFCSDENSSDSHESGEDENSPLDTGAALQESARERRYVNSFTDTSTMRRFHNHVL
jgi:hypothetical protein